MFFDDRMLPDRKRFKRRNRDNVVAWLNKSKSDGWWLNVVKPDVLCLLKPIPRAVNDFGDAIDWVLYHSEWRKTDA